MTTEPLTMRQLTVDGKRMAFHERGEGEPIVFQHGNPTSSYLWRNVIPHVEGQGRCVAPDLIGFGDSDKLDDPGPGSYSFIEHRHYLDGLLDRLALGDRVTLVLHDWGSALGFDRARRHSERVAGIAYMEAIVSRGAGATGSGRKGGEPCSRRSGRRLARS
jgi:haloalkane dehalogenase